MAEGDFTAADLDIKSKDEAGMLATALNTTKNKLSHLLNTAIGQYYRDSQSGGLGIGAVVGERCIR